MKLLHELSSWIATPRAGNGMWNPSSASAFASSEENQVPYPFLAGLVATIGLCLGLWVFHAKQQQAMAIEDCVVSELSEAKPIAPENAESLCEMKCLRGELPECS